MTSKDELTMRKTMTANRKKYPDFCAFVEGLDDASEWLRRVALEAWRRETGQPPECAELALVVQSDTDEPQNAVAGQFDGVLTTPAVVDAMDLYHSAICGGTIEDIRREAAAFFEATKVESSKRNTAFLEGLRGRRQ